MPRSVEKAWFFDKAEKEYVLRKLEEDNAAKEEEGFTWREVGMAFKLPQVWFTAVIFFLDGVILYSLA